MSDASLRRLQRAWESNPGDQEALAAYVAALRSAGQISPPELLAQRVFPARTIRTEAGWTLEILEVGAAEARTLKNKRRKLLVPEHRSLEVRLEPEPKLRRATWSALRSAEILDVYIDFASSKKVELTGVEDHDLLERLDLSDVRRLGKSVANLAQLPYLASLSLEGSVTDLSALRLPESLTALGLSEVWEFPSDDEGLQEDQLRGLLAQVPDLRELSLRDPGSGLKALRVLRSLTHLHIADCGSLEASDFVALDGLPLQELSLHDYGYEAEGPVDLASLFRHLSKLPLKSLGLDCDEVEVTADAVAALPESLEVLDSGGEFGAAGLEALSRLSRLRELTLGLGSGPGVGPALAALGALPNLIKLELDCPVDPSGLSDLAQVQELAVHGLGAEGARHLPALKALKDLTLAASYSSMLSSKSLTSLRALPALECLFLCRAEIGDLFSSAKGFPKLRRLSLEGCDGLKGPVLGGIAALETLEELVLTRGTFRSADLKSLKVARPDLGVVVTDAG